MLIRNEKIEDYRLVEEMIKRTFWNLYVPGCTEHYFAHLVRQSHDFLQLISPLSKFYLKWESSR